jgi:hypothetical protein
MHVSGQIKTVPIRRIHHATHETIHPLTHTDVDVQLRKPPEGIGLPEKGGLCHP